MKKKKRGAKKIHGVIKIDNIINRFRGNVSLQAAIISFFKLSQAPHFALYLILEYDFFAEISQGTVCLELRRTRTKVRLVLLRFGADLLSAHFSA